MDYTSLILSSISLLTGLAAMKFVKPVFLKIIIVILGITVITEAASLKIATSQANTLYNTFSFFDITVWLFVFYKIHQKEKIIRWIIIIELLVVLISIIESYYNWGLFQTRSIRLYNLVIVYLSVFYLYRLLYEEYYEVFNDPIFFVCIACIFYHSLSFIKFTTVSEPEFFNDQIAIRVFYILDAIANILYYPLLCVAFIVSYYCHRKNLQFYPSS